MDLHDKIKAWENEGYNVSELKELYISLKRKESLQFFLIMFVLVIIMFILLIIQF